MIDIFQDLHVRALIAAQTEVIILAGLSMKFIMRINVKMLTIISMIKTTSESSKPRKVFIFSAF